MAKINHVRIGTRRSHLAVTQSQQVAQAIRDRNRRVTTELVEIVTTGDRTTGPLADIGGKGLFTEQLEQALRDGWIDLAVHSAKDLPTYLDDDLAISAVPERQDPRDALVTRGGLDLHDLGHAATVGTGSLRRGAQIRAVRGDLKVAAIRGNIETRLKRALEDPDRRLDAVVLAMAGLNRSGLAETYAEHIRPLINVTPAAGQGALAVETLKDNAAIASLLASINDSESFDALAAERAVLFDLKADCHSCVAIYFRRVEKQWLGVGMAARSDGSGLIKHMEMAKTSALEVAGQLAESLRQLGAMELLHG